MMTFGLLSLFLAIPSTLAVDAYSLPTDLNIVQSSLRSAAIKATRATFTYGPDIAGDAAFFPKGVLGKSIVAAQLAHWTAEAAPWTVLTHTEAAAVKVAINLQGGLKTYDDYAKLYNKPFFAVTIPNGPAPGMLTNYTSDLLFSMERLSTQPFSVRRLGRNDKLNFKVDDASSKKITTLSQKDLQAQGRLFYADYRTQADQGATAPGKFAAAADAYFYIHPTSGDFLPLAIRPNMGSPLIYTPLDPKNDWQLAKMLFECNDFYFAQWYHLGAAHELVELVYMAAVRSLSDDHPIHAVLSRLGLDIFVFRPAALVSLLNDGGPVDELLAWNASAVPGYSTTLFKSGGGSFKKHYFKTDLEDRGLINNAFGPKLKSLPFFDDASVLTTAIKTFFTSFVDSYYTTDSDLALDSELQKFLAETQVAEIADFPFDLSTKAELVDALTHYAYLISVLHGTLNGGDPVHTSASLPLHPTAVYQPLPTQKNLTDAQLLQFMPNLDKALGQISLLASFNRPYYKDGKKTLSEMFDDEDFLEKTNDKVRTAATTFKTTLVDFSENVVRKRKFDKNGLSQGMPFIWTTLDPQLTSFSLSV